jgi:hypothetical protein
MLTPVPSTLPDSLLSQSQVLQKFSVASLAGLGRGPFPFGFAGLGCDCSDIDPDSGICNDPDPCPTATSTLMSTSILDLPTTSTLTLPTEATVAPGVSTIPSTTVSSSSLCGSSDPSDQALCSLLNTGVGTSATTSTSSSGGLTNAQIAGLASQLASGASTAAILSQLPAGYSIKNGQIIAPTTLSSLFSGTSGVMLLGLGGLALVLLMSSRGKGR